MSTIRKSFLIGTASNWLVTLIIAVSGLILVPIIWARLGKEAYGVWALLAQSLAYVTILDRALTLAINRCVAYYREDMEMVNSYVSASLLLLSGLAMITVLAAWGGAHVLVMFFDSIPDELAEEARWTCVLVAITMGLRMIMANYTGALRGFQMYGRCNAVTSFYHLMRVILVSIGLSVYQSIVVLQLALVIAAAITTVLICVVAKVSIKGLQVKLFSIKAGTYRELINHSFHSVARSGSAIAMYSSMFVLVGWRGSASDVAVYDIAFRIPSFLHGILASTQNVFLPIITSLYAKKSMVSIQVLIQKGTRILFFITISSVVLLAVYTQDILRFWLRKDIPEESILIMRILLLSIVPGGIFEIWLPCLVGIGKLGWLTNISIFSAVLAILLATVLLLTEMVSAPLAAAFALVTALWLKSLWMPWYGVARIGLSAKQYFYTSVLKASVASIIACAIIYMLEYRLLVEYYWGFRLLVSTGVLVAGCGVAVLWADISPVLKQFGFKLK